MIAEIRLPEPDRCERSGGLPLRVKLCGHSMISFITFKHLLLPVWIGAYRFRDKAFQVMVNARTGEVQGEWPLSFVKLTVFVLFIFIIVLLLFVLFQLRYIPGI
jgi:hypothetical protein